MDYNFNNLEIKFSVFEVLKLLLFIFLKDRSIVREQENMSKNFRVICSYRGYPKRHIIVMIWIKESLESIVDASVGLYSLFITFIWKHRNFIAKERPPDHIHSLANLSSFAFFWHQGNNKVMSF